MTTDDKLELILSKMKDIENKVDKIEYKIQDIKREQDSIRFAQELQSKMKTYYPPPNFK